MSSKKISREDLLILLASMGIVLAKDNKLPVEELNKRLGQALDASQEFSQAIKTVPVDPYTLPDWPSDKKLYDATRRGSITDSFSGSMAQPKRGHLATKEEVFKELRQSIWSIAYALDIGAKDIFFVGEGNSSVIHARLSKAFEVENETPLFFILYKEFVVSPGSPDPMEDVRNSGELLITSNISDLERRTLLTLFAKNSKRLDPKYLQTIRENSDAGFSPSFVLPIGPIGMKGIGSLTSDSGCEVCGKKTKSRCVGCLSVVYCGKECQVSDWKNHKLACKSLKGGSWHPITLSDSSFYAEAAGLPAGVDLKYSSIINRLDSLHSAKNNTDIQTATNQPPSSIQSGKIFLAKFQIPLGGKPTNMMIYDRSRSFRLFWQRKYNPELFDRAVDIIGYKMKFYRWIKQTNGFEFEICLDRAPQQDPAW